MVKKIVAGFLFAVFAGALVTGAVIRTQDRVDSQERVERSALDGAPVSGQGQRGQGNGRGESDQVGSGQGKGAHGTGGQGKGSQGAGGSGSETRRGAQKGVSESQGNLGEAIEWETLAGVVVRVSEDELVIELDQGAPLVIEGRSWSFALEQGFTVEKGDALNIGGFYEDGELKVGHIEDLTNGQSIAIRSETGRPNWAGGGRGGQ